MVTTQYIQLIIKKKNHTAILTPDSNQLLFLMILKALIKSVFDFLCNVLLEIYFSIRALTKHLTNETEKYNDLILLFYF